MDPDEDAACQYEGTWVGMGKRFSLSLLLMLIWPLKCLNNIFNLHYSSWLEYFCLFVLGFFYAVVLIGIYRLCLTKGKCQKGPQ